MPTIRDVCAICNNQRLSWLDAYGNQLYRDYFSTFVATPINVTFEYDYTRLLGWLLKCSYNSSRSEGADVKAYHPFLPFLLGQAASPALSVTLLLGIVAAVPSETPLERRFGPMLVPSVCAYGQLNPPPGQDEPLSIRRVVMMQSYLFFVLVWDSGVPRAARRRTLDSLARANKVTRLRAMRDLRADESRVRLDEPCLDIRTWLHVRAREEARKPTRPAANYRGGA